MNCRLTTPEMRGSKMTAEQTLISKHVSTDRALKRFFVVSGSGQGMRFYDPATQAQLTIHNIANWINQRINTGELTGWSELVHKRWSALMPEAQYKPNERQVFELEPGLFVRNMWAAPEIEPDERADPTFFIDFLDHAIGKEDRAYVIRWLAWQYQRPLEKPHTGLYLYGAPGTGKSSIAHILEKVFGQTAVMRIADQSKLGLMSNVDVWSRTLLIVEEAEGTIKDKLANTTKSFMGTSHVNADRKHEHFGTHFTPANLIMLSNNAPTMLEKEDRRWYVKEMGPQAHPETYFKSFYHWLERCGYGAIAHLLATTDISDIAISDRPRWTEEKSLACDTATKQDVLDVQRLIENASNAVQIFTADYFTDVCNGNRLMHIAKEVGLKVVNLNTISGSSRCKAYGFTEAECKRLFIPLEAQIRRAPNLKNRWVIEYAGIEQPLHLVKSARLL
jgi:hypothetical protein